MGKRPVGNVFEKWNPSVKYLEGEVVYFGDKLYIATYGDLGNNEQENIGVLPMHRQGISNVFNTVSNNELVDQLIVEYNIKEDSPITTNITFDGMDVIGSDGSPMTFTDEDLFYWELV
jgi:hypothetical protein